MSVDPGRVKVTVCARVRGSIIVRVPACRVTARVRIRVMLLPELRPGLYYGQCYSQGYDVGAG